MRVIAVDWSGDARLAHQRIWLAEAETPGRLERLESGLDRTMLSRHLCRLVGERVPLVIGLDFGFAFPSWYLAELGTDTGPALWARVARDGETWLAACASPFWGRRGCPRPPPGGPALRRAERAVPRVHGVAPKSVFQVGGAGAVGTGSIRGMPLLLALHVAGARIWPFTAGPAQSTVCEIYPRLLTGPVVKSSTAARASFLAAKYSGLALAHRDLAIRSADAFDAAVSALVMVEHAADLARLPAEQDPELRAEGRIWHPTWRTDQP
jgi:hypothetical protein